MSLFVDPWFDAEWQGNITVNQDCFMTEIINDLRAGIDVSDYQSYSAFAQVYIRPCSKFTAAPKFDLVSNLNQVLGLAAVPTVSSQQMDTLKQQFGSARLALNGGR